MIPGWNPWTGAQIDRFIERYRAWRDNGGPKQAAKRWGIAFLIAVTVVYAGYSS
jgi:hypothetical protein